MVSESYKITISLLCKCGRIWICYAWICYIALTNSALLMNVYRECVHEASRNFTSIVTRRDKICNYSSRMYYRAFVTKIMHLQQHGFRTVTTRLSQGPPLSITSYSFIFKVRPVEGSFVFLLGSRDTVF